MNKEEALSYIDRYKCTLGEDYYPEDLEFISVEVAISLIDEIFKNKRNEGDDDAE